ncbi:MAG: GNAT family N-acetyltransferase [bacterium]
MKIQKENILIKKCNLDNLDSIYELQQIVVDMFREEEKGYYLPFSKEDLEKVLLDSKEYGEIHASFYENKMIGWVFLSVHKDIEKLLEHIPHITGQSGDIDGVMVHPDYRGNNIQTMLLEYIFEIAKNKDIENILAEITIGNTYSFNNIYKLDFKKEGEYFKNNTIQRDILVKKIQ